MPGIAPFAAIRYDLTQAGDDLSNLIAPPYDVLDETDKSVLLGRSPCNIVALDLPYIPPKSAGPAEGYQRCAFLLDKWLADGTLTRESKPALYLYHQQFEHAGRPYTRRMFIARVRLQPFSNGSILPHERTFGGPKEDRLALMKATSCQLSPILGLYTDPEDRIESAFTAVGGTPDLTARLDGVENQLWIVTDPDTIRTVANEMADRKIYIADGHHRYGTALLYRDWFTKTQGGSIPDDHPANYIMFALADMDDPGCLILPYHRALANVDIATVLDAWSDATEPAVASAPRGGREGDPPDLVVFDGATGKEAPLRFTRRDILATLQPGECPAWYSLDTAYLHRYLIDELLGATVVSAWQSDRAVPKRKALFTEHWRTGAGESSPSPSPEPKVVYVKSAQDARRSAREHAGVALLVNATPMAHLRAVSEQAGLMPAKSTYFHPKLATGLTINPLA